MRKFVLTAAMLFSIGGIAQADSWTLTVSYGGGRADIPAADQVKMGMEQISYKPQVFAVLKYEGFSSEDTCRQEGGKTAQQFLDQELQAKYGCTHIY